MFIIIVLLSFLNLFSTEFYIPSINYIVRDFHIKQSFGQYTISIFIFTLSISQLFWGVFSDKYGSKISLLIGSFVISIDNFLCFFFSKNMILLILFRIIHGFASGASTSLIPALLRKNFFKSEVMKKFFYLSVLKSIVPLLAPNFEYLILLNFNWRINFLFIFILSTLIIPIIYKLKFLNENLNKKYSLFDNIKYLMNNRFYLYNVLVYSIIFSSLVIFSVNIPNIIEVLIKFNIKYYLLIQVLGVSSFIISNVFMIFLKEKYYLFYMKFGLFLNFISIIFLLIIGFLKFNSFNLLIGFWVFFCSGLGFRTFNILNRTLSVNNKSINIASSFLMFVNLLLMSFGMQFSSYLLNNFNVYYLFYFMCLFLFIGLIFQFLIFIFY